MKKKKLVFIHDLVYVYSFFGKRSANSNHGDRATLNSAAGPSATLTPTAFNPTTFTPAAVSSATV